MIVLLFALAVGVRGEACVSYENGLAFYYPCDMAWTLTAVGRPGTLAVCHPKSAADFVPGAVPCRPVFSRSLDGADVPRMTSGDTWGTIRNVAIFSPSGYMALGALNQMRDPFVLVVGGMECIHLHDVRGVREAWDWRRGWHWAYYWDGRSFVSVGQMIPWRVRVKHRVGCWLIGAVR